MYLLNGTLYSQGSRQLIPLADGVFVYVKQDPEPLGSRNSILDEDHVLWHGILAVLVGAACFGTMHVPIRKYHTGGDGFFVQWVMSMGILTVGFMVNIIEMSPPVRIYAVFGGMLWTIANSLSQYVISGLGLAVGLVLWNTTNCLTGWLSGRFGLFWIESRSSHSRPPEYSRSGHLAYRNFMVNTMVRVLLASIIDEVGGKESRRGLLFAFVRRTRRLPDTPTEHSDVENAFSGSDKSCIVFALLSGFFYGATTIPVIYMEDHPEEYPSSSRSGIPYIFSHYFGIFIGSSIIFVVYALFRKNKPIVNPAVILPSMLGGMIWGVGMVTLFMSNDILTQTVTYPVMTTLPGCIASLWSVFYFKEINSKRNYVIICFAFVIIATGAVFVFLSKIDF